MRKLLIGLLLVAACKTSTTEMPVTTTTAPSGARLSIRRSTSSSCGGVTEAIGARPIHGKMSFSSRAMIFSE